MKKRVTIVIAIVFLIICLILLLIKFWPEPPVEYTDDRYPNEAPVIIECYSDFECPFCHKALSVLSAVKEKYGDEVEIQFKHFIVHGAQSRLAAQASECARDQGMFDEYKHALYEHGSPFTTDVMENIAQDLGLNRDKFSDCLESGEKDIVVRYDQQVAKIKGISATPTFIINNDIKLVGLRSQADFEIIIDRLLTK
ncbi:hypothetical protein DRJ17_02640 [Candidatus Woesearchaeota archaeon]|nr:MAG: hypothetical protein DRJ17_02640 [Candidatus Woesearchaeota archaeon]